MKFNIPCFVRIKDSDERKEIAEWLKQFDYITSCRAYEEIIFVHNIDIPLRDYIDCNTDIGLFKALEAMNDKNDYEQYFVYPEHRGYCAKGN